MFLQLERILSIWSNFTENATSSLSESATDERFTKHTKFSIGAYPVVNIDSKDSNGTRSLDFAPNRQ